MVRRQWSADERSAGAWMNEALVPPSRIAEPRLLALGRGRSLRLQPGAPLVMAIVNVTPDSFSDGGVNFERTKAVETALRMGDDGAAIIDIGGESTRPGAQPVALDEEIERVVRVIEELRARSDVAISIDTRNAAVARQALEAGADIVNDVTALRHDSAMREVVARAGVPVILMHMRGDPRTMQSLAVYRDVVSEVAGELQTFCEDAAAGGIEQVLVDPGIGFAKNGEHNLEILARCEEIAAIAPMVVGASRKKFVGTLTGREAGPERLAGSLAAVAAAARGGASIVRVHDVRETVDFLRVHHAIEEHRR